jgi:hypothetical protein
MGSSCSFLVTVHGPVLWWVVLPVRPAMGGPLGLAMACP